MTGTGQAPQIDTSRPHAARMYDYVLGGTTHHEADARAAEAVLAAVPNARPAAHANRDFVLRAIHWLAREKGVRQFLDIGSGIPTEPNLHQVAQAAAPSSKIVYTDHDPLARAYALEMLHSHPDGRTAYVHGDLGSPERILDAPELSDTLDFGRPIALSVNALFHSATDELRPYEVVRTLLSALPAGSFLVLTHATADFADGRAGQAGRAVRSGGVLRPRTKAEVSGFFDGLEMVEPGLVVPQLWRPDAHTAPAPAGSEPPGYVGVGRKR